MLFFFKNINFRSYYENSLSFWKWSIVYRINKMDEIVKMVFMVGEFNRMKVSDLFSV